MTIINRKLKCKKKYIILFLILILKSSLFSNENLSCFCFGGNYTYEYFKPNNEASFHGNLGGIQANYQYKKKNSIYESIKIIYRLGELKGSTSKRFINDIDGQGNIGYTISRSNYTVIPFTGFGWRYIHHKLKQAGLFDITFAYNEVYIPVGIDFDYRIKPSFSIGLRGTWMPQVFASVDIKPIGNARWALTLPLGNVMVQLPFTFYFSQNNMGWFFQLKPFFQYWQDGKTLASTSRDITLDVPKNSYFLGGAEINFGFSF